MQNCLKVTLKDILVNKEERKSRQETLRREFSLPVVSITINMPGDIKDLIEVRKLRDFGVTKISEKFEVKLCNILNLPTGPEAQLVVDATAEDIKQYAINIEEQYSFGRLLDIDVFNSVGELISRAQSNKLRKCFVCGQDAITCMRNKTHSIEVIINKVDKLLNEFKAYLSREISYEAECIGTFALEAMLFEVSATPSPGLVDRLNPGAHKDMDFFTFMTSTAALSLTLKSCAQAGINHIGNIKELLPVLRCIGLIGERNMFKATQGINTQKGLLFSLGLMAGCTGFLLKKQTSIKAEEILDSVKVMTEDLVKIELQSLTDKKTTCLTAGEKLYKNYGLKGIRGEVSMGMPCVQKALIFLKENIKDNQDINTVLLKTLIYLMTMVEDTTIVNRHDLKTLQEVQGKANFWLEEANINELYNLDKEFILRNISPGGTADLLAVTWFLYKLEMEFNS